MTLAVLPLGLKNTSPTESDEKVFNFHPASRSGPDADNLNDFSIPLDAQAR